VCVRDSCVIVYASRLFVLVVLIVC
jgi:hypothetical protein